MTDVLQMLSMEKTVARKPQAVVRPSHMNDIIVIDSDDEEDAPVTHIKTEKEIKKEKIELV